MKRLLSMLVVIGLLTTMFAGCGKASDVEEPVTEAPVVDTVPATETPSTEPAPTETEADFEDSMTIIEEAGFAQIHAFPYSPREGTNAYKKYKELS